MPAQDPAGIPAYLATKIPSNPSTPTPAVDVRQAIADTYDTGRTVKPVATGAVLGPNCSYLLMNAATYTVGTSAENDELRLSLPPLTTTTVSATGIGVLKNTSSEDYLQIKFMMNASGTWKEVEDTSMAQTYSGLEAITDAGYQAGRQHYCSFGALGAGSGKATRDFGSGNLHVYDGDKLRSNGTKQEVLQYSRLRNPWIRLNDLNLDEGPSITLAQARSNSEKLRLEIEKKRVLFNNAICITGTGVYTFADEISNVHWPNHAATKQTVSNATYNRSNGTITLSGGGWTALGLDGPGKVFRIEDDTNPANDGVWITAEAWKAPVGGVPVTYVTGDCVYQGGNVYRAPTTIAQTTFSAGAWTLLGTANNVLAVRNHPFQFDNHPKFPVNGTATSLGIVVLHTGTAGTQGRRTALGVQAASSGSLYLRRYAGGPVIRRYAGEQVGVLTQDSANGPGGVAASQSWYNNGIKLDGIECFTPIGNAIYLDGSGHSGTMCISEVNANSKNADFAAVFLDNCYSGKINSLQVIKSAGHGVQMITCNSAGWQIRVESAGDGVNANKHGVYAYNCNGDTAHLNCEGCSGLGVKWSGGNPLLSGYLENNGSGGDYDAGTDFTAQYDVEGDGIEMAAMRIHYPGNQGLHFGGLWTGWRTPLTSNIRPDQKHVEFDVERLAKILPEGGLTRERRAIFRLRDYYNWLMKSARYNGGAGGSLFNLNEAYFDCSWGTELPYESPAPTTYNGAYVGLEYGNLRFRLPANSHAVGYDGGGLDRSIRWMDYALPATNQSPTAFTWVNSGGASVAFAAKDFSTRRQYRVTVTGVDWAKLGVREGMDCDITGFTSDVTGADSDPNKRFTVVNVRDNQLWLAIRRIDGGTEVTSLTESLTGITFAFDWPEQKFSVQNLSVASNDVLLIDVQYTVGAAHAWFKQFATGKKRTDPLSDYHMPVAKIGLGGTSVIFKMFARGPGVHRERFIWRNDTGSTWQPGSPTGPTNQIVVVVGNKVNTTQWPIAGASPAYDLVFSKLDFVVASGSDMGV